MFKLVQNKEFGKTLSSKRSTWSPSSRQALEQLSPYLEARGQEVEIEVEPELGRSRPTRRSSWTS